MRNIIGHMQQFERISRADFERLVINGLADADTAHLTFTEYFYRRVKTDLGESTASARTQIRSIRIEYDLLFQQLKERMPISQMAKFLHATEAYIVTLTGFSAWRSLLHAKETGIFRDVLETHRDCLRRCIHAAGGWKKAYLDLINDENGGDDGIIKPLPADTDLKYWPIEMRCKLLEHIRNEHILGKYTVPTQKPSSPPSSPSIPITITEELEFVDHVDLLHKNERDARAKSSRQLEVHTHTYIHTYIHVTCDSVHLYIC